jgi:hypothetical protein
MFLIINKKKKWVRISSRGVNSKRNKKGLPQFLNE